MYIVKRDGRQESVHFGKISARLKKLCYGLSTEYCDPVLVARKVSAALYDGVTTTQVDELAAETAAAMTADHPDFALLAVRIAVSNLHKNTRKSFSETAKEIHSHYTERSGRKAPLIPDDVYEIILKNAARLDSEIIYDRDYDYDYYGFKALERSYQLKIEGKVVEIHKDDIEAAIRTYHLMSQLAFAHVCNPHTCIKEVGTEGICDTPKECGVVDSESSGISVHNVCATEKPSYHHNLTQLDVDGDRELVRFMRKLPPAHCIVKIESFSDLLKGLKQTKRDKYECTEFSTGGYKWCLSIYPEGNKKDNGKGHISLYLKMVDKIEATVMVNTSLKFFILDQKHIKYLTVLDIKEKHFHALKNEWGVPRLLPRHDFNDVSNGFLIDDSCVFGVEAFVVSKTTVENGGTSSLSVVEGWDRLSKDRKDDTYTWEINNFSELKEKIYSPVFTIKGYDWKLLLYPHGNGNEGKNLSIYLCPDDFSVITDGQKLETKFEACLKNRLEGKDVKKNCSVGFCHSCADWGFTTFLPLKEFNDPLAGFKVNDSVILQLTIEAIEAV